MDCIINSLSSDEWIIVIVGRWMCRNRGGSWSSSHVGDRYLRAGRRRERGIKGRERKTEVFHICMESACCHVSVNRPQNTVHVSKSLSFRVFLELYSTETHCSNYIQPNMSLNPESDFLTLYCIIHFLYYSM